MITFGKLKVNDEFYHGGIRYIKIESYHDAQFGTVNARQYGDKESKAYFSTLELVQKSGFDR